MSSPKRTVIYTEGGDDREFLSCFFDFEFLGWKHDKADRKAEGKAGVVSHLLPFVSPANGLGGQGIMLLDIDKETYPQFFDSVERDLKATPATVTRGQSGPRLVEFRLEHESRAGRLIAIAVGKVNDSILISEYGVNQFSLDDWTFQLARIEKVYNNVSEFRKVPYATSMKKHTETAKLFRDNGLVVEKSNTYLNILRTVTSIGASTSTLTKQVCAAAKRVLTEAELREQLGDIFDDLELATKILCTPVM
ncbi:MAG: hypothetical protein ACRC8S_16000 [Fimbriiglobus sp.]